MTPDRITVIALLSAQLCATMAGIWRASAWVQRIEDRLWYLEKFCDQLGPVLRPRRDRRDRA